MSVDAQAVPVVTFISALFAAAGRVHVCTHVQQVHLKVFKQKTIRLNVPAGAWPNLLNML